MPTKNLDKMGQIIWKAPTSQSLLQKYSLGWFVPYVLKNLNSYMNTCKQKIPGPDNFIGKCYQTFKEENLWLKKQIFPDYRGGENTSQLILWR